MPVLQSFAQMGLGMTLLLVGAEGLVRGASALALRFGLTPLVVGLTVVAFGTSSPELVVSLQAALQGDGGLAIGNVVGSNVANLALIVGLAAAVRPIAVPRSLVRWDLPILLLSAGALVLFLHNDVLGRVDGAVLSTCLIVYVLLSIRASRKEVRDHRARESLEGVPGRPEAVGGTIWRDALLTFGGLAMLIVGSDQLLVGAVATAERLGVSQAVIGLTIVAVGTSLPELATTVVAAVRRHGDIALGNAIGSNIFNVFGVLGPAAVVAPMARDGIENGVLFMMIGVSAATFLLLWTGLQAKRWEGFALLSIYAFYLWWVIPS